MAQYTIKKIFNFINAKDILSLFLLFIVFPFAIVSKIFIRGFWLVTEDENEARDNGYWFFKWVRENRKKQKIAYAINKKSVDYKKVKNLGKVISFGSISHWFWYIVADKNISSQKGGKPNAAVCYLFEVVLGLRKSHKTRQGPLCPITWGAGQGEAPDMAWTQRHQLFRERCAGPHGPSRL